MGRAQRSVEVTCGRCGQQRWTMDPIIVLDPKGNPTGEIIPLTLPYTCLRCRAVLAGRNAEDPMGTPAQRAARQAHLKPFGHGKKPRDQPQGGEGSGGAAQGERGRGENE